MSKPITEIDDPRLVKALAHPLRIRILGILEQRSATPKELAELLDVQLENLSYHVRTLRDFGFIKLERRRMVKGAVEHRYGMWPGRGSRPRSGSSCRRWCARRSTREPRADLGRGDPGGDPGQDVAARVAHGPPGRAARRAGLRRDVQGGRPDRGQARRDREAVGAAPAQAESPEVPTVLIAMLFDAPDDDAANNGRRTDGAAKITPRGHRDKIGKWRRSAEEATAVAVCTERATFCAVQTTDKVPPGEVTHN